MTKHVVTLLSFDSAEAFNKALECRNRRQLRLRRS